MKLIGVAAQQDAIAPLEQRDHGAPLGVGPKAVGKGPRHEVDVAPQPAQLARFFQEIRCADFPLLEGILKAAAVNRVEHLLRLHIGKWSQAFEGQLVIEEADDVAEIEDNRLHPAISSMFRIRSNHPLPVSLYYARRR